MWGELNAGWQKTLQAYKDQVASEQPKLATRVASKNVLIPLTEALTDMISGSADLEGSNKTKTPATSEDIQAGSYGGRFINYGIREHGMAACMNGMGLPMQTGRHVLRSMQKPLILNGLCRVSSMRDGKKHYRPIKIRSHWSSQNLQPAWPQKMRLSP